MSNAFPAGLEPALLWQHFDLLCSIPHGSGNEAALRDALAAWADERGYENRVDAAGNLLVQVPATPGLEGRPCTVIQGHIDMVCEKNADVEFDFVTQGLELTVEGEFLTAVGTTLGADNGIGVATGMAIADDPDAAHGPLELLFTVDEETGLTGAFGLERGALTGTRLLNLDTEEEGAIYIGCAGGGDVRCTLPRDLEPRPDGLVSHRIEVKGLKGGHSGLDIHENRANAIKCLARVLAAVDAAGLGYRLARIEGGSMRNAIPREARSGGCLDSNEAPRLREVAAAVETELKAEFAPTDPDLTVAVDERPACGCSQVFGTAAARRVVDCLLASPSSVLTMSREVPGLVETSTNLGVIHTLDETVEVVHCCRSSVSSALEATRAGLMALWRVAGGEASIDPSYPGWQPNLDSPLLALAQGIHEELYGYAAEVKAVHAGLECGLLGEKAPGIDMLSIGPTIHGAHSPDERVSIPSTERFYGFVKALLAAE